MSTKLTRIMIAIPVHNRIGIARLCIPTVHAGMDPSDELVIFNDGTKGDFPMDLLRLAGMFIHGASPIGVDAQRMDHLRFFNALSSGFTHLYLTDADALHDPSWRRRLLELQELAGGRPVCGYNTLSHSTLAGNTLHDAPGEPIIWRAVAPGISYLLTREHVKRVAENMPPSWDWDWAVPSLLGRMAIARESVVDHISFGGLHHPAGEGVEGGDRALDPTPWLIQKRDEVINRLALQSNDNPIS